MKIVILAGGSGTRLWPYSRKSYPKQFLKLIENFSFLQGTIERALALTNHENIFIVTYHNYYHVVREQVNELDAKLANQILLEPFSKNTMAALALSIRELLKRGSSFDEELLILPSDHLISPIDKFVLQVKEALLLAQESIVTFGLSPTRPETGYGYLKQENGAIKFIEKPTHATAQQLLMEGDAFWNSGMFLFSIKKIISELKKFAPSFVDYIEGRKGFEDLDSISIDIAVMEKTSSIKMVPLTLSWSDVGSWDSVYELSEKDEDQNVVKGNVQCIKTEGCLVYAESRLVTTLGLKDLYIIETADALLVMNKEESQGVKGLVELLKREKVPESDEHKRVHRPWGYYTILEEGRRYKIKQILVYPYQSLSLQSHSHRSEHWVVVSGMAKVIIEDREEVVLEEESVFVPKQALHRITNPDKVPLIIIEVQVGDYLGEDDIVRFEDVYGRVIQKEKVEETQR